MQVLNIDEASTVCFGSRNFDLKFLYEHSSILLCDLSMMCHILQWVAMPFMTVEIKRPSVAATKDEQEV